MSLKESDIQKQILEYLTLKGVFHWRNNTGAAKTLGGGFIRFGTPGSPDIFALKNGILYGIEVKTPVGRISDAQEAFLKRLQEAGGSPMVVRSLDDVMAIL